MKMIFLSIAMLVVVISLSSCKSSTSSFDGDVRKMAEYLCQIQKLEAKEAIKELLKNGPVDSTEFDEQIKMLGISKRTASTARKELGIKVRRVGGKGGKWEMELPSTS